VQSNPIVGRMDGQRKRRKKMISINKNKGTPFRNKSQNGNSAKCRRIRGWLHKAIISRFHVDADWVQNHIANCPRCNRRLVNVGKVNLALSAMKSQPHKLDLLMRANTQAIGVLKHSLREATKARKLRAKLPEPKLFEKCGKYAHSAANVAACITILLLMKIGVFSSMDKFQTQGQKAVEQYYASQVGEDLADEIFSA
jgi:hypothetical protein